MLGASVRRSAGGFAPCALHLSPYNRTIIVQRVRTSCSRINRAVKKQSVGISNLLSWLTETRGAGPGVHRCCLVLHIFIKCESDSRSECLAAHALRQTGQLQCLRRNAPLMVQACRHLRWQWMCHTGSASTALCCMLRDRMAGAEVLKIDISQLEGEGARGLVAKEDIQPGELLLSVPFTTVFEDTEVQHVVVACCLPHSQNSNFSASYDSLILILGGRRCLGSVLTPKTSFTHSHLLLLL